MTPLMMRVSEVCKAIEHVLHVSKPLLVELLMFIWAFVEIIRFASSAIFGHGAATP